MEEEYVSTSEIKAILEKEKADRGELTPEQSYALQHASTFSRLDPTKGTEMVKELMVVPMMSLANASKIADLLPRQPEDVRSIFAKERYTLEKDDLDKVLEIVGKYV